MSKQEINIVWLKRDLRTQDHLAFKMAEDSLLPYLIIYLLEPSMIAYPDTSLRHLQFQYHSILQLNKKLASFNKSVMICYAEATDVFNSLLSTFKINAVYSYKESGIQETYNRDLAIEKFLKDNNIEWMQFQRDGIIRGIKDRKNWDKRWFEIMHTPIVVNEFKKSNPVKVEQHFSIPEKLLEHLENYPSAYQPAGEDFAWMYLSSFVSERGFNYSKHISKPQLSRISCGRISPYLSWGNISIRQAYQFIYNHTKSTKFKTPFKGILTRLKWHCHFIQKFEVECAYETQCINAGYELIVHDKNDFFIRSWKTGKTGFPLVDACMKCLIETGWLNFRMRAMLVSFFCHHLNQDWRKGSYYLAKLFLDYEPGIHYPQFQMQAGTTGINTIRIYNPVKQSMDHDEEGVFIKKWLPQLKNVPTEFIHEPYKMSLMEQELYRIKIGVDYPAPIVSIDESGKNARKTIWGHRKNDLVQQENKRILFTHTRRKNNEIQS